MADYDRRQSGGHYNRKRRYRDDDDGYDRRNNHQRRRVDTAPAPVRLRRQLVSIADSPLRRWAEEVQGVANLMADNYDDEQLRDTFVKLVMQLLVEQPLKTPFVAAVVRVLNALKPEMTPIVLQAVTGGVEKSIGAGEWRDVKNYLKFLACLQGMFEGDGLFPLLDELFSRAADLQTASSEDTIGTEIVKIILLTIPYAMASAPAENKEKAAELMGKTEIIASEPHALQEMVEPYHAEAGEEMEASPSLYMLLQKQLQNEADDDWKLSFLPRPWEMPLEHVELQDKIVNAQKHALPAIKIPDTVVTGLRALFPEVYFSVYAGQEVDSVPGPHTLASTLIRDTVADTLNILDFNRNVTARFLMDIDSYFADNTFVKRATPFDDLRNIDAGRTTWKPEDVAVDAVFSQLFQLPASERKVVYYHSVLTEACKLAPAAIAPSLGRAIRYMYRNSPRLDVELTYRFVDWFAHHLSNFGFTWKWTEWSEDASLPALHPNKWFIRGSLDKEIRLSFAQRIQKTLPEPYQHLIGPEKEQDEPPFKYKNPDTPFSSEGQELANLLRRKASDEDIQPVIDAIEAQASERGLDPTATAMDAFVTAICWVGSKSLSHVLACIDRSKTRLLDASVASAPARAQILSSVIAYWHAHPGIALSILEKLLNYSILTPLSVVDWTIGGTVSPNGVDGGAALGEPHILEFVFRTVSKVSSRVRQLLANPEAGDVDAEITQMRELFSTINDALSAWADGSKEQITVSEADAALIHRWGQRWLRMFQRHANIEEAFIAESRAKQADVTMDGNGDAA